MRAKVVHGMLLAISICLMVPNVHGQDETPLGHMKKDKPSELFVVYIQSGNCGESFERIVDNELTQSHIKRTDVLPELDTVFLMVGIKCHELAEDIGVMFNVSVRFSRMVPTYNWQPGEMSWELIFHAKQYNHFGIAEDARSPYVTSKLHEKVKDALSDYLRINFDL